MVDTDPHGADERSGVSRRRFVQAAGASGVAAGVAGCLGGGGGDDSDENVVQLSADQDFADISDDIEEALHEAGLDEEISIEVLPGDFETDSRQASYSQALDAGRSEPDIFMMDSGWTIPFIVREHLDNLTETLSDDVIDYVESDYLGASVDTARHPETGDLYGLPLFPDYPVMQYRKDLVEEAGFDPEGENWATEPMSWQEFAEVVAEVWEYHGGEEEYDYGFTTQADAYEGLSCCTFNETMSSFGGAYFGGRDNLFGPIGDRPITVEEEPVLDTIRMMRSFMLGPDAENTLDGYPQITNTDIVQYTEEDAREPFTNGNAIFHRNWPYSVVINGAEDVFGEDLGTMPMPYGVEASESDYEGLGGSRAALGGWHLTLNTYSQKKDQATQVLEAFANENVMLTLFELN
ncbi:extracellular solute-binding protein, partial [Haloparvum sedimenti]|uniref:extracellular solute-binding protein n=1 Tax=Haloparvum sedimenti TaxID=1678448 RepID=UPI00071E7D5A